MTPDPTLLLDDAPGDGAPDHGASHSGASGATADEHLANRQAETDAAAPTMGDDGSLGLLLLFVGALLGFGFFRSWWIPGIIAGLLFMLFMHELGHYLTARASGMKVTEFFLGFGPKIWSFRKGETEYGIKAIPAGAYVRIIGMTNLDDIDPADEPRTYREQPYWQRMVTICAGSFMHFVMAFIALLVLFAVYQYPGFDGPGWEVARVVEGSSAERIGLEPGDRIVSFNGEDVDTWEDFGELVGATAVGPADVVIERDGTEQSLTGELGARSGDVLGAGFGLRVNEDRLSQGWQVDAVLEDGPAARFGLQPGDVLLRFGDSPRPDQRAISDELLRLDGADLTAAVLRGTDEFELDGAIELDRSAPFRAFLGIGPRGTETPDHGWVESVGLAVDDFGNVARTNIAGLFSMLNPMGWFGDEPTTEAPEPTFHSPTPESADEGTDEVSGRPVSVVGMARLFADSESVDQVLYLFMAVNIFIGIFNLFPVLPLDGGHAALATYERGRQLVTRNRKYRVDASRLIPLTWAVVLLLVVVGVWTAYLDIFAWSL